MATQTTQAAQATEQAALAGTIRVAVPEHSLRTDARAVSIVWRRELIRFQRDRLRAVTHMISDLHRGRDGAHVDTDYLLIG